MTTFYTKKNNKFFVPKMPFKIIFIDPYKHASVESLTKETNKHREEKGVAKNLVEKKNTQSSFC